MWICRFANGYLQSNWRDDQDRKEYLYHELWHKAANRDKFRRFAQFGRLLPGLRRTVIKDLRGKELSQTSVPVELLYCSMRLRSNGKTAG